MVRKVISTFQSPDQKVVWLCLQHPNLPIKWFVVATLTFALALLVWNPLILLVKWSMVLCFMHALPQGDPTADPDHAGEIMFLSWNSCLRRGRSGLCCLDYCPRSLKRLRSVVENEWVIANINGDIIFLHSNPVIRLVFGKKCCTGVPFKGLHSNSIWCNIINVQTDKYQDILTSQLYDNKHCAGELIQSVLLNNDPCLWGCCLCVFKSYYRN